jgi:hypothetical protein
MASSLLNQEIIKRHGKKRAGMYLLIYTFCFCLCLFLLNTFSTIPLESIEVALAIEALNITVLFLLGITLFTIVCILQDMEFTAFMSRLHREIRQMNREGTHPIVLRPNKGPDWRPNHLNDLLSQLNEDTEATQSLLHQVREQVHELRDKPDQQTQVLNQIKQELSELS